MKQTDRSKEMRLPRKYTPRLLVVVVSGTSPGAVVGVTQNIDANGVSFFVSRDIEVDPNIQFILEFPPEIAMEDTLKIRCTGQVVRVDRNSAGTRIVALINEYDFL